MCVPPFFPTASIMIAFTRFTGENLSVRVVKTIQSGEANIAYPFGGRSKSHTSTSHMIHALANNLSMKATRDYGPMATRARLALDTGCDMVLVCNDRPAAQKTVASLREYSNPLSLVRLARLHGTGQVMRETLLASEEWLTVSAELQQWSEPPELRLDA